jgi:hypothetical protein
VGKEAEAAAFWFFNIKLIYFIIGEEINCCGCAFMNCMLLTPEVNSTEVNDPLYRPRNGS